MKYIRKYKCIVLIFILATMLNLVFTKSSFATEVKDSKNKIGDLNNNDIIDIGDIVLMQRHISATSSSSNKNWKFSEEQLEIADINHNDQVDLGDILLLLRYIAASNSTDIGKNHMDWLEIETTENNKEDSSDKSNDSKLNSSVIVFNTIAEMEAYKDLQAGDVCQTLGYYLANDGGAALYKIVDDDTLIDDGGIVFDLNNNLKASLLISNTIRPENFGAKGDATTDDSEAIQKWLDAHINHKNYVFDISSKTYAINKGLNINYEEENYLIDFKNATINALNEMDYMMSVNSVKMDDSFGTDISDKFRTISGGHWNAQNKAKDIILYRSRKTHLTDMHLLNAKENYVDVQRGAIIFKNSFLDRRDYSITDSVGINITGKSSDSKISDIQARDIKIFTKCNGGSIFYRNCHAWLVNILTNTVFCEYSKGAFFDDCYADTYNIVFKAYSGNAIIWSNGTFYWNTSLLPKNYEQPIILAHGEGYTNNINVYFDNTTFNLYSLYKFGVLPKYTDTVPTNDNNLARNDNLLSNNSINPNYIENLPLLAGYRNESVETLKTRSLNNGDITYSEVRYIGNGFLYVKGVYRNDLGYVATNYGFGEITQNNIQIAEQSYLNGIVYNSETPNVKKSIVVDVNQFGYLHTFVEEKIDNVDRIEFSGLIRCNMLQGF